MNSHWSAGQGAICGLTTSIFMLIAGPTWAAGAIVTDGDTVTLGVRTFRLDGIDAPEIDQICLDAKGASWPCGIEVRDQLIKLIGGRSVSCEDKGPDTVYGARRIGVCTVDGEAVSLNQLLVRQGLALNFEPYARGRFSADEANARASRRGVWQGCFSAPQDLRHWNKSTAKLMGTDCGNEQDTRNLLFPDDPAMPPGCSIKGKFARRAQLTGNRGIYHFEGCSSYRRVSKPNRWFCSEDEALAAGFRKAYTCQAKQRRKI